MAEVIEIEPEVIDNVKEKTITKKKNVNYLILFNTDYHTFEEVIMAIMLYCGKTAEEAIADAMRVHEKGKASILDGTMEELKPIYEAFRDKTLKVTIE